MCKFIMIVFIFCTGTIEQLSDSNRLGQELEPLNHDKKVM